MTEVRSYRRLATVCALALAIAAGGACAGGGSGGEGGEGGMATTHTGSGAKASSSGMGPSSSASSTAASSSSSSSVTSTSSASSSAASSSSGDTDGGPDAAEAGPPECPPLTGTAQYPAETEPNDMKSQANALPAGAKGFTAAICPVGDVDTYSFQIATAGSSLTVKTSDGMGGCPLGAHTYLRVVDDAGNVYAEDPGTTGCASLSPANMPALSSLAAGTYYVHVESSTLFEIAGYTLDIAVKAPDCGDGVVEVGAGEQCDHGASNGTPSDGCSAACKILSGTYVDETEPNNTPATANNLDGKAGAVGEINPPGDVDWYSVDITVPGSSITAEVGDGFGGCPDNFASEIFLYSPSMMLLISDKTSGVAPCSKISPLQHPEAAGLPVGKYTIAVESTNAAQAQPLYVLSVKVTPPMCGDGILPEGTKECDPPTPNPGCSATCQLTGDYIKETESNNTLATANALGTHAGFIGSINPAGDADYFSFNVPGPTSLVFLDTSDGMGGCPQGLQSVLELYGPSGTLLAQDTTSGSGGCSAINPNLYAAALKLPAGKYTARVAYADTTTFWQYVLDVSVRQPGCGNGFVETGEQCDDGAANGVGNDPCNANCTSVAPWEIEPNNATAQATSQFPGFTTWKAHIMPAGDHDYFSFSLAAPGTVTLTTHDVDAPTVCNSDTQLYLLDHTGTQIGFNDDSGPGPGDPSSGGKCSQIAMALPAGQYFAWVKQFSDKKIIPTYQLDLLVQ